MSIRTLTIGLVNFIEKETGDPFHVIAASSIDQNFFKGYMYVKFPGLYRDFSDNSDFSHRMMYENCDVSAERGDHRVEGNAYVQAVLSLINDNETINDDIWDTIGRSSADIDAYYAVINKMYSQAEDEVDY